MASPLDVSQVGIQTLIPPKNNGPPTWVGGPSLISETRAVSAGAYLPARYVVHTLFMRVFCPPLNVFMQES